MTPREALHVIDLLLLTQESLARPLAVPGARAELARGVARDRATALRLARKALSQELARKKNPKELAL